MKNVILAATVLAGAFTGSAYAADLPSRKAPVAYVAPLPLFTWTGFYVGANGGIVFSNGNGFGGSTGGTFGGTVGYNYQFGQFVVGAEGDFNYADVSRNQSPALGFATSSRLRDFGTARLRLGYAIDRVLIYGTGGYAGGDVRSTLSNTVTGFSASNSGWRSGYTVGGGVEYAFTNNISAKVEYLYTSLESKTLTVAPVSLSQRPQFSTVRVGLNYKF